MSNQWIRQKAVVLVFMLMLFIHDVWADPAPMTSGRFFYSGDGYIRIAGKLSGKSFNGQYRSNPFSYDQRAYKAICRVFGVSSDSQRPELSLRLIEFLDYLQDRFGSDATMTITSGYRSPTYNTRLRKRGGLAAKASLHQYGMAADLRMTGVDARQIWDFVKSLGFGGAGYYHGDTVHIDVGPARSWDEKSTGVGTGISDDNKLIGLVTDFDRYRPGDKISFRFIRMTGFPIGVSSHFMLEPRYGESSNNDTTPFSPSFGLDEKGACPQFSDIEEMADIQWQLPQNLSSGRYVVTAEFCGTSWPEMPSRISTPEFEVIRP